MLGARAMPQFSLRMPSYLMEAVKEIAMKNGRSINSEIVQLLKEYVTKNHEVGGTRNATNPLSRNPS